MRATTVRAVVTDIVTQTAPQEAPVLAALTHVDDAQVRRMCRKRRGAEPLGFGLAEVTAVVTPIVWLAVDEACRMAVQSSVASTRERVAGAARKLFRREPAAVEVPELSREQLALVHRRVLEDARRAGLEEEAAATLADQVVARLLLAAPGGGESAEGNEAEA